MEQEAYQFKLNMINSELPSVEPQEKDDVIAKVQVRATLAVAERLERLFVSLGSIDYALRHRS